MNAVLFCILAVRVVVSASAGDDDIQSDLTIVREYIVAHANDTFREPSGFLKHPYLVPAGPYEQCWDWDAVFTGVALLDLGSATYLAGSMMNFFEATDLETGSVTQCLDPVMNSWFMIETYFWNQASFETGDIDTVMLLK
jgi:hypothetical protein